MFSIRYCCSDIDAGVGASTVFFMADLSDALFVADNWTELILGVPHGIVGLGAPNPPNAGARAERQKMNVSDFFGSFNV